ncbi:MAG: hypothetical protein ACHQT9_00895 [Candidatus Saccharimonadales bacterium]
MPEQAPSQNTALTLNAVRTNDTYTLSPAEEREYRYTAVGGFTGLGIAGVILVVQEVSSINSAPSDAQLSAEMSQPAAPLPSTSEIGAGQIGIELTVGLAVGALCGIVASHVRR